MSPVNESKRAIWVITRKWALPPLIPDLIHVLQFKKHQPIHMNTKTCPHTKRNGLARRTTVHKCPQNSHNIDIQRTSNAKQTNIYAHVQRHKTQLKKKEAREKTNFVMGLDLKSQ
jgi:hypothetical protein